MMISYTDQLSLIIKIQRWWKKTRPLPVVNNTDFVTMEPINGEPFYLVEETNHVYQFNPLTLANYYLKEGNFVNPYTRRPLNPIELKRLDKTIKKYHPHVLSLCEEQKRINILRAQEREHTRMCHFLHQECLQLVATVLFYVQNSQHLSFHQIMYKIQKTALPNYFQNFRQLFIFDYAFACDSISHVIGVLQEYWNNSNIANTREGCNILESVILSLSKFMSFVVPMLPIMLGTEINFEYGESSTVYNQASQTIDDNDQYQEPSFNSGVDVR